MAAHASDWGHSLNQCCRGGANGTPWWWCLWGELCWFLTDFFYYSYCRKPTEREFFVPALKTFVTTRTQIVVKLLTSSMKSHLLNSWPKCLYSKAVILFSLVWRPQVCRRNNNTTFLGWCLLYFALVPLWFYSCGIRGSGGGPNGGSGGGNGGSSGGK